MLSPAFGVVPTAPRHCPASLVQTAAQLIVEQRGAGGHWVSGHHVARRVSQGRAQGRAAAGRAARVGGGRRRLHRLPLHRRRDVRRAAAPLLRAARLRLRQARVLPLLQRRCAAGPPVGLRLWLFAGLGLSMACLHVCLLQAGRRLVQGALRGGPPPAGMHASRQAYLCTMCPLHVLTSHAALRQGHCLCLFAIPRAVRRGACACCVGFYALSRNAARMLRRVDFGDMRIGAGEDTTMGMCAAPHACHTLRLTCTLHGAIIACVCAKTGLQFHLGVPVGTCGMPSQKTPPHQECGHDRLQIDPQWSACARCALLCAYETDLVDLPAARALVVHHDTFAVSTTVQQGASSPLQIVSSPRVDWRMSKESPRDCAPAAQVDAGLQRLAHPGPARVPLRLPARQHW